MKATASDRRPAASRRVLARTPVAPPEMYLAEVCSVHAGVAVVNGHSEIPTCGHRKFPHAWMNSRPHVPANAGLTTPDFSLSFNR